MIPKGYLWSPYIPIQVTKEVARRYAAKEPNPDWYGTTEDEMVTNMRVEAKVTELLEILQKNRAQHSTMVEEARAGYIEKARDALMDRLNDAKKGKTVSLDFSLRLPADYTHHYDTVIGMLELHQTPTITVSAQDYQSYVQDQWSWSREFFFSNSLYSGTARNVGTARGYVE